MNRINQKTIYNQIYNLLLNNGEYFRPQFNGMFDSDDDICYEISHMVQRVSFGHPIEYCKKPTQEFHNELMSLVTQYIKYINYID